MPYHEDTILSKLATSGLKNYMIFLQSHKFLMGKLKSSNERLKTQTGSFKTSKSRFKYRSLLLITKVWCCFDSGKTILIENGTIRNF